MKTLFLNPNSNDAITRTLQRQIAAQGLSPASFEVRQLAGAPKIIGSLQDNMKAQRMFKEEYKQLTPGFTRLVMMSSLDTGFDVAREVGEIEVYGFTRSVLAWHRSQAQQLQAITFDPSMTSLYQALFATKENQGVVGHISTLPLAPGEVESAWDAVLNSLRRVCRRLTDASSAPIFIVGAVGLELGETLRQEGFHQVIDPVANLIAHLQSTASAIKAQSVGPPRKSGSN